MPKNIPTDRVGTESAAVSSKNDRPRALLTPPLVVQGLYVPNDPARYWQFHHPVPLHHHKSCTWTQVFELPDASDLVRAIADSESGGRGVGGRGIGISGQVMRNRMLTSGEEELDHRAC